MGSLKKALLFVPRMMAGLSLLWSALTRWCLIMCYLFLMMALFALALPAAVTRLVVSWIRESYDDDAT